MAGRYRDVLRPGTITFFVPGLSVYPAAWCLLDPVLDRQWRPGSREPSPPPLPRRLCPFLPSERGPAVPDRPPGRPVHQPGGRRLRPAPALV